MASAVCTFALLFVLAAVVVLVDSAKEEDMWKDLLLEAGKVSHEKHEIELILLKIRNLNRFPPLDEDGLIAQSRQRSVEKARYSPFISKGQQKTLFYSLIILGKPA